MEQKSADGYFPTIGDAIWNDLGPNFSVYEHSSLNESLSIIRHSLT